MEKKNNIYSANIHKVGITGHTFDEDQKFRGVKRAGKDYLALCLKEEAEKQGFYVQIYSLAFKLKKSVAKRYFTSLENIELRKEEPLPELNGWSYRGILNTGGTEVGRNGPMGDRLWIYHADKIIKYWQRTPNQRLLMDWFDVLEEDFEHPDQCKKKIWNGWSLEQLETYVTKEWARFGLPDFSLEEQKQKPFMLIVPDIRFQNEVDWILHPDHQPHCSLIRKERFISKADTNGVLPHATDQGVPSEFITHTCPSFSYEELKPKCQSWAQTWIQEYITKHN